MPLMHSRHTIGEGKAGIESMGNDQSKGGAQQQSKQQQQQQQQQSPVTASASAKTTAPGGSGGGSGRDSPDLSEATVFTEPSAHCEAAHAAQVAATPVAVTPEQVQHIAFNFSRPPLGQGGFSTVYEGMLPNGMPVAVKILNIRNLAERQNFDMELAVLMQPQLRHPNLLPLLAYCTERPALVMPRLKPLNRDRLPRLPGSVRMRVAMDVARGLAHLHQSGFVHNDMKPDNVLLEFNDERQITRALVGDLGCAKSTSIPVQPFGTLLFMDPALQPHGPPVLPKPADDVYSFGLTIVCIFTNQFPMSQPDLLRMWAIVDSTFPRIAHLARRMTSPDPNARPTCTAVVEELAALDAGWRQQILQQQQQSGSQINRSVSGSQTNRSCVQPAPLPGAPQQQPPVVMVYQSQQQVPVYQQQLPAYQQQQQQQGFRPVPITAQNPAPMYVQQQQPPAGSPRGAAPPAGAPSYTSPQQQRGARAV